MTESQDNGVRLTGPRMREIVAKNFPSHSKIKIRSSKTFANNKLSVSLDKIQ